MDSYSINTINRWIEQAGGKEIVLVIGAGFSKNAVYTDTREPAEEEILDWNGLIEKFRTKLNDFESDSLMLFDFYKSAFGNAEYRETLLSSLPDDELSPSKTHYALYKIRKIRSIITTNNLDTLLDKTFPNARKIIFDKNIAEMPRNEPDIIYLHGHRKYPESWIFSRNDYDEFEEKYKLKFEFTRLLLAQCPSLFIGFGLNDSNLHLLIKSINKFMGEERPAMISLTVGYPTNGVYSYWDSIGMKIISIDKKECEEMPTISDAVKERIDKIAEERLTRLKTLKIVPQGERLFASAHEELTKIPLECRFIDGKDPFYCKYHDSRRKTVIYRLNDTGVYTTDLTRVEISMNSDTYKHLQQMKKKIYPTGSWGLMPEHRRWLEKYYKQYSNGKSSVKILLTGIAGLPHFVDITTLLFSFNSNVEIEMFIIDICEGPIHDIKVFRDRKDTIFEDKSVEDRHLYVKTKEYLNTMKLKLVLISNDILKKDIMNETVDIVLSHKIASFLKITKKRQMKRYAKAVSSFLKTDGLFISAQNVYNGILDKDDIFKYQDKLNEYHLKTIGTEASFDVYDVDEAMIREEHDSISPQTTFYANKETLLTVHEKISISS